MRFGGRRFLFVHLENPETGERIGRRNRAMDEQGKFVRRSIEIARAQGELGLEPQDEGVIGGSELEPAGGQSEFAGAVGGQGQTRCALRVDDAGLFEHSEPAGGGTGAVGRGDFHVGQIQGFLALTEKKRGDDFSQPGIPGEGAEERGVVTSQHAGGEGAERNGRSGITGGKLGEIKIGGAREIAGVEPRLCFPAETGGSQTERIGTAVAGELAGFLVIRAGVFFLAGGAAEHVGGPGGFVFSLGRRPGKKVLPEPDGGGGVTRKVRAGGAVVFGELRGKAVGLGELGGERLSGGQGFERGQRGAADAMAFDQAGRDARGGKIGHLGGESLLAVGFVSVRVDGAKLGGWQRDLRQGVGKAGERRGEQSVGLVNDRGGKKRAAGGCRARQRGQQQEKFNFEE